jgi:hypothetical protein
MYVIAQPSGLKGPKLFKTKKTEKGLLGRIADNSYYGDAETYLIKSDEVILYLGDEPAYGVAYGVLVEPILKRYVVKGFGTVYSYADVGDAMQERISKALLTSYSKTRKQFPNCPTFELSTEIRATKGRVLGSYQYRPKDVDNMVLRPNGEMGMRELVKLITHELGHGVWNRGMTSESRSRWIKRYDQFIEVSTVTVSDVKRIVRSLREMQSVKDYLKECEPEDLAKFGIYAGWLHKIHGMSKREMQDMISAGEDLPIADTHLHKSDVSTPITLYSKENPQELFCEAWSSLAVGDLSNKGMLKLLNS